MKSTALFVGVLFGLSFLVSGAMLVTATMKPQWFMLGSRQAQADSLQAQAKKDSLAALAKRDTASAAGRSAGQIDTAAARLKQERAAAAVQSAAMDSMLARQTEAQKQAELQSLVKLYEAMKPEDAARILSKQEDKDIRAVILHIKKKQAAKILSNFNADRAAQILAQ